MHIGERIFGNYDSHIQENTRTDISRGIEPSKASVTDLTSLKEGAVFKGQVLEIAGDKVTIAVGEQSVLAARMQGDVALGIGDQLLFSVKENNASQILIKPMFDSLYSAQTQVLEKALDATGLSPTEKNFTVAKELMEAGMPLDKGNMVKLLSQSMKHPDVPVNVLVHLNKMNIPVTEENIQQYERYQNANHQLTGDLNQTIEHMTSFVEDFPPGTHGKTMLSVTKDILDIFMQGIPEEAGEDQTLNGKDGLENHSQLTAASINGGGENYKGQESDLTGNIQKGQMMDLEQNTDLNKMDVLSSVKPEGDVISDKSGVIEQTPDSALSVPNGEDSPALIKDNLTRALVEKTELPKESAASFVEQLKSLDVSPERAMSIIKEAATPEDVLKGFVQELMKGNGGDASIQNFLLSDSFQKLFSDMVRKNWSLNPQEMQHPKEIDKLYNKILRQGKEFQEAIAAKGGDTKEFQQSFQQAKQNMQFMEQLNQQMIYAQMPLRLSNQQANSELYVYADKRKLAQKKDGISVMLHLDMDHLGQTDVHVTLTGTTVNARFYLGDQESVDILETHMKQLAKQLADRGFSLTNEVVKRQPAESVNKVVDEVIDENAERSIKRYTFDART